MKTINSQTFTEIEQSLPKLGFVCVSLGHYVLDDFHFKFDRSWSILEKSLLHKSDVDFLQDQLDQPGFWKYVVEYDVLKIRFDLPPGILSLSKENDSDKTRTSAFEAALTWAISTADRELNNWSVLSLEDINLPEEELIVQYDQFIRRGYRVCEDNVLALRFPILDQIPVKLETSRRNMLHAVLLDAQNRWRMVRFRMVSQQGPVEAEVDFSGVPSLLIESMLRTGLDALRECVKWLVASVDVLVNPKLKSNIFRVCKI